MITNFVCPKYRGLHVLGAPLLHQVCQEGKFVGVILSSGNAKETERGSFDKSGAWIEIRQSNRKRDSPRVTENVMDISQSPKSVLIPAKECHSPKNKQGIIRLKHSIFLRFEFFHINMKPTAAKFPMTKLVRDNFS